MRASLWIVLMLASAVRIAAWSRVRPRLQLFLCSSASSSSSSSSPPRSPGSPLQAMCDSLSKIKNIAGATSSPLQNAHIEACMQAMSQVTLQDVGLSTPVLTDMQCFYIQETPTFHVAVFILPKGKALSLHDHPGMAVCSRLLRGSLRVRAYTPTETPVTPTNTDGTFEVDLEYEGVKTPSDGAWVISPSRGNIHELRAEEDCVILDVLLPPYKEPDRPCNFYVVTGGVRSGGGIGSGGSDSGGGGIGSGGSDSGGSGSGGSGGLRLRRLPSSVAYRQVELPYAVPYRGYRPCIDQV